MTALVAGLVKGHNVQRPPSAFENAPCLSLTRPVVGSGFMITPSREK